MRAAMHAMMKRPPFTAQDGHVQCMHERDVELQALARTLSPAEQLAAAQRAVERLARHSEDDLARRHVVSLLAASGQWTEAAHVERLLERFPDTPICWWNWGGAGWVRSGWEDADRLFARAVLEAADPLEMEVRVAGVLAAVGRAREWPGGCMRRWSGIRVRRWCTRCWGMR